MIRAFYIFVLLAISFEILSQNSNAEDFAEKVFSYICEKEILHPQIVMQQAIIETGGFYPNNTMKKNNLFGFKKGGRVMIFNSWKESVDFYRDWQDRKYTDHDEDYYNFLVRIHYATNKKYISHLKGTKFFRSCNESELLRKKENSSLYRKNFESYSVVDNKTDSLSGELALIDNDKKRYSEKNYTVKKGDTLYDIARKNKTTVDKLKKANKLSSNMIKPGQKLKMLY